MRIAGKVTLEKRDHPDRFCREARCLWRVQHPGQPDTPCPKHPQPKERPMLGFKVDAIKCKDLRPGDLFSTAGPEYWNGARDKPAVGEKVYVRTEAPCPADQANDSIFRILITGWAA